MKRWEIILGLALLLTLSPILVGGPIYILSGIAVMQIGYTFDIIMFGGFFLFQIGIVDMVFNAEQKEQVEIR